MDYITIPGANIETIKNAFRMDYVEKPAKPLDVAVVAGYNDLVKGHTRDFILEKLYKLSEMGLDAESGLEKITIAISTLMYPPQLVWFSYNGRIPYAEYVLQFS